MTIAIEVSAWRISAAAVEVLRFASAGFTTQPTDTPANAYFEGRLQEQPRLSRTLFDRATTYGASRASAGKIRLLNTDGGLDNLVADYAFDGRPFTVKVGQPGTPVSGWATVMSGLLDDVSADDGAMSLQVRDRLAFLGRPLARPKYAGSNMLPDGVEGTKDDLKDQYKPRVYGGVFNVPAKAVNTSKLVYQVSDQACTVTVVYDNGVAWVRGADYASQADLLATAPAAGTFRCWLGLFRLGSMPIGQVTADAGTAEQRAGALLKQLALDGEIPAGDIVDADVTALNAANSAPVGVWVDGEANTQTVMDELANAIGAWYGFDRLNRLRMGRLTAPTGVPVAQWSVDAVTSLVLRSAGVPNWRAVVRFGRNYTVQAQPAGSVAQARKAFLAQEYRQTAVEVVAVKTAWPSSEAVTFDAALVAEADAAAEATRRSALYSVRRILVDVEVPLSELGDQVDLGVVVALDHPRYGLAGRLLRVIGLDAGVDSDTVKLTLWG
ncbi:hypothetical protein CF70_018005 [Cupriavidus sp. SK-3]|uniref:hypothetical protein n=1 Tax=Cupriavidus sp. SK-3 TaxID=1470558 RepID=UPI0004503B64|nr:hypothetical protein [Cupriavidus sp. SK-3]KDP84712.1 hypothetical protein CF70_018005 [Cupriavidus sp. SK-3]